MTSVEVAKGSKAFEIVSANDDVIQNLNLEQLTGTHQIARYPNISFTGVA